MNARNAIFVLLVLLSIVAVASSAYAIEAGTWPAQQGAAPPVGAISTPAQQQCNPTFISLTVNGQEVTAGASGSFSKSDVLSGTTCIKFKTKCNFQKATFEVWGSRESHADCKNRNYSNHVQLNIRGEGSKDTEYVICTVSSRILQSQLPRLDTMNAYNFRAEICPNSDKTGCTLPQPAGCLWAEVIPSTFGEIQKVVCKKETEATDCDDKNPCTEDVCENNACKHNPIKEGDKVVVDGKEYICKNGVKTPIEGALYISKAGVSGSETSFAAGEKDKAVDVKLTDKLNIEVKNVKKNTALSLFKGGCPQTEATENILAKINAISVTSDTQQFINIVVNTFSSAQQVSICQYDGSTLRSDSLTVNVAPDAAPCTNLICALAKIDQKMVMDIFKS